MKTYVITLSRVFPKGHPKCGQPTWFEEQFLNAIREYEGWTIERPNAEPLFIKGRKLHTIRANFDLWQKRFQEIYDGNACLSVRQWTGAPYRSKQKELARLTKDDGIRVQMLRFRGSDLKDPRLANKWHINPKTLAANDGLTFEDWQEWFKGYDLSQPLAIIQFTNYKYV